MSPVQCDLSLVPYPKLSDYQFFKGDIKNLEPVYGLLPYKPTSELFSDYAQKKRFVWMPKSTNATYVSDSDVLDLPVGAVIVKVFYYNNLLPDLTTKIIETRLMIRKTDGWIFAEYIWNDEQTDALLQTLATTREGANKLAKERIEAAVKENILDDYDVDLNTVDIDSIEDAELRDEVRAEYANWIGSYNIHIQEGQLDA